MSVLDVAIVGAGPYGMSVAAHLHKRGLQVLVFGQPMSFWSDNMPRGMRLRSPWVASNLSDPNGRFTLDAYRKQTGQQFGAPVPLQNFVSYCTWFAANTLSTIDTRRVRCIGRRHGLGYQLMLDDGDVVTTKRVVIAAGILPFARRLPILAGFSPQFSSHSSEHRDLSCFAGKRVLVIGAGQSAVESAALMHGVGAEVEVLVRRPSLIWLKHGPLLRNPVLGPLLYAWPDVGPAFVSHLVAHPHAFTAMPRRLQSRLAARSIRPAVAAWVEPDATGVKITCGTEVRKAERVGKIIRVQLSDGTARSVDHVFQATGYKVDISKYQVFSKDLLSQIPNVDGYPRLNHGFEAVPGLHIVGAPAAWSFGPLMRFVAGADFAARAVTRAIVH